MKITLGGRVRMLEIGGGLLAAAFLGGFWFFLDRIDDRFDKLDAPMRQIQIQASAQTEALKSIDQRLSNVEHRIESMGPKAGQK